MKNLFNTSFKISQFFNENYFIYKRFGVPDEPGVKAIPTKSIKKHEAREAEKRGKAREKRLNHEAMLREAAAIRKDIAARKLKQANANIDKLSPPVTKQMTDLANYLAKTKLNKPQRQNLTKELLARYPDFNVKSPEGQRYLKSAVRQITHSNPSSLTGTNVFKKEGKEKIKEKIKFTGEEMAAIGRVIFQGEESFVEFLVKDKTGQKNLEGYQKILIAPGNAIEGVVRFGISLFNKKTYADLLTSLKMIQDPKQREILGEIIKKGWQNCTTAEKTAFIVEIAYSALFVYKGLDKLTKVLPAAKAAVLMDKLKRIRGFRSAVKATKSIIASPADEAAIIGSSVAGAMAEKMKDAQ